MIYGCGADGGNDLAADSGDEADVVAGERGPMSRVEVGMLHHAQLVNGMFPFLGAAGQARIFDFATAEPLMVTLPILNNDGDGMVAAPLVPSATDFVWEEDDDQIPDLLFGQTYTLLFQSIDCLTASDSELLEDLSTTLLEDVLRQHLGQIDAFVAS
jgi:hypothetical protein